MDDELEEDRKALDEYAKALDMYAEQDVVIFWMSNVQFANDTGDLITTDVRVVEMDAGKFIEYRLDCKCSATNWIPFGVDSGEFRCSNCTEWLGSES